MVLFETLFVFLLIANIIGIIPGFVSPTQVIYVPAGEEHRFVDVTEDLTLLVIFAPPYSGED